MKGSEYLRELAQALGGIPVWGCVAGSLAEGAGLRPGDIVVRVNGRQTPTIEHYLDASRLRRDGMEIVVYRKGTEHTLKLCYLPEPASDAERERRALPLSARRRERRLLN